MSRPLVPAGAPTPPYTVRDEKRLRSVRVDDARGEPVGLVDPGVAPLFAAAPDLYDAARRALDDFVATGALGPVTIGALARAVALADTPPAGGGS